MNPGCASIPKGSFWDSAPPFPHCLHWKLLKQFSCNLVEPTKQKRNSLTELNNIHPFMFRKVCPHSGGGLAGSPSQLDGGNRSGV